MAPKKANKPVVNFRYGGIYIIIPIRAPAEPYIIQWIGFDKTIDFNSKEIVGCKTRVKYMFISDARNHMSPILNNTLNIDISLNNIKSVIETNLVYGNTYKVGDRNLILRGFIKNEFYVSEDPHTNNYEIYHNVPIDEKKQIFRIPYSSLINTCSANDLNEQQCVA